MRDSNNRYDKKTKAELIEIIELMEMELAGKRAGSQYMYTIQVYIDDGRVFEYDVERESSVREHASAIVAGGYRHNDGNIFEHYPPHRILKVKCVGKISTLYLDKVRGT